VLATTRCGTTTGTSGIIYPSTRARVYRTYVLQRAVEGRNDSIAECTISLARSDISVRTANTITSTFSASQGLLAEPIGAPTIPAHAPHSHLSATLTHVVEVYLHEQHSRLLDHQMRLSDSGYHQTFHLDPNVVGWFV
jgi:hypothetical protein